MSTRLQPWYKCENNLLTVTWPTDGVFPVDVKDIPESYKTPIIKSLNNSPVYSPELVVIDHNPP